MFKEYMDDIYERFRTETTMHDTIAIISDAMEEFKDEAPDMYKKVLCKLEKYLYKISLEEATEIVAGMENEYGMKGGRWTYEQVCDAAKQHQIPETIDRCELYIVMNMWATDYQRTMKHYGLDDRVDIYLMFSCDWLTDTDFGKGKVYKYFVKLHKDKKED